MVVDVAADPAPEPASAPEADGGGPAAASANPARAAAARVAEALVVAAATSTGLYLVGSVYVEAYYGRLSVQAAALDLPPPYVALQAVHALPRLLEFPATLLLFWVLWRTLGGRARRLLARFAPAGRRFPRLAPLLANLAVVAPLVAGAVALALREAEPVPGSVLGEVVGVLGDAALVLVAYAAWLGWSRRRFLVAEVRARRPLPIALAFAVYLLTALGSTALVAEQAAELLAAGASDAALGVEFLGDGGPAAELAGKDLVLVAARGGAYHVVEREPFPPGPRPTAYLVPFGAVDGARVRRLTDAGALPALPDPEPGT